MLLGSLHKGKVKNFLMYFIVVELKRMQYHDKDK